MCTDAGLQFRDRLGWLRYQPESKLTRWYEKRGGQGRKRLRKIRIVALARKLLIDCWIYLETGLVPEGAELHQLSTLRACSLLNTPSCTHG